MSSYSACSDSRDCQYNGTYRFPQVLAKHQRNLVRVLDDLPRWESDMVAEFGAAKFRGGKYVRYHDAGDFFSDDYTRAWLSITRAVPDVTFYGYTEEVRRFRLLVEPDPPENFLWCYFYGGSADHLLDAAVDRVADVFPTPEAITAAGFHSNAASDLLAVLGPSPVGMCASAIPHLQRAQGDSSFREWQEAKRSGRYDITRGRGHS